MTFRKAATLHPGSDTSAGVAVSGQAADLSVGEPTEPPATAPQRTETSRPEPVARATRRQRLARLARREARRTALAVAGGLALGLAFPPYDLWPLSLLAVAALSLLTWGRTARQGAWTGFAFGLPFFVLLLKWLNVVGWDAVIGLSIAESLFFVPLGAALALTSKLPGWPLWAACLWVAQEWARDRVPFGGFPWGRLAFANTGSPFTPLAALGGAPLVTFAVALAGVFLAAAAVAVWRLSALAGGRGTGDGVPEDGVTAAGATADTATGSGEAGAREAGDTTAGDTTSGGDSAASAAAGTEPAMAAGPARGTRSGADGPRLLRGALPAIEAIALAGAVTLAGLLVPVPTDADDTVDIAVVQGNVQQPGMDFLGRPMKILNNHVEATLQLAKDVKAGRKPQPDLVIWPENASDLDPYQHREAYSRIDVAVKSIGVPILVGALVDHPTKQGYVENQGIVWDPKTGPGASYTKQHPVPFGEYVPFRDQLGKVISRLERVPRDFYPGDHSGVMQVGPAKLGDVICFEVAYDEIVRDTVNAGARALVIQTNNATYGRSGQPEQQLVMSKLRAIEHGRAVVTAAPSGISAVVAPDGTIEQRTKEFTQDVLSARIPLRDDTTVADRLGAVPEWVIAMVGVLSCAAAIMVARRGRTDEKGMQ
ncbi:apolipoprotein N-acyltransferase [Streptomyces zagrosensis]|uniref:Apolipoprotein N-acyltransferase n=1 Tax=Streptomyces zagrosensis TaxID=1042984 RepID=A0A7W9QDZ2_9ACTN|nr:apolipoprotein N-acyltransferase [Streptomyces zagrosensis]MBB5938376.1 apolipoprotein N-acyltransferase [Streptomyces zagrosensis]